MAEIRIEPFNKAKHDRSSFSCGQPSLDAFLRTLVTQYEKRRLGRTFVAARPDGRVLGYFTLASSAIAFENMPPDESQKLPKHPVPTILLGRLAVDRTQQGQGLGETLLMSALAKSLDLTSDSFRTNSRMELLDSWYGEGGRVLRPFHSFCRAANGRGTVNVTKIIDVVETSKESLEPNHTLG